MARRCLSVLVGVSLLGLAPAWAHAQEPDDEAPGAATLPADQRAIVRIHGEDRYQTAAALVAALVPSGARVVYIASGAGYPDALVASPAAAFQGGPVLFVPPDGVSGEVREQLTRLAPERIVVLGGSAVIPDATVEELAALTQAPVERIAGADRYETAAAAAAAAFPALAPLAFVASGENFPDAISASAAAAALDAPLLLTGRDTLHPAAAAELTRLAPQRVIVVGGDAALSQDVVAAVAQHAEVERIGGVDRYATSALLALAVQQSAPSVLMATGDTFPDSLAAGALAGLAHGSVLLTPSSGLDPAADAVLRQLNPTAVVLAGGPAALSPQVAAAVSAALPGAIVDDPSARSDVGRGGAMAARADAPLPSLLLAPARLLLEWAVGDVVEDVIERGYEHFGYRCVTTAELLGVEEVFSLSPDQLEQVEGGIEKLGGVIAEGAEDLALEIVDGALTVLRCGIIEGADSEQSRPRPASTSPPVPAPATLPPDARPAGPRVVSGAVPLRVRDGASTSAAVLTSLPNGTPVTILCTTRGETVNGRWGATDLWDYLSVGGYATDGFIYTGTSEPVAPPCSQERLPGSSGAATPPPIAAPVTHYDCANDRSDQGRYVPPGRYWRNEFVAQGSAVTGGWLLLGANSDDGSHAARVGIYRDPELTTALGEVTVEVTGYDGEAFAFPAAIPVSAGEVLYVGATGVGDFTAYNSLIGCFVGRVQGLP